MSHPKANSRHETGRHIRRSEGGGVMPGKTRKTRAAQGGGGQVSPDRGDISALVSSLKSSDSGVRFEAAQALGKLGPQAAGAVPALVRSLQDADPGVRFEAAHALSMIGPTAASAVRPLALALRDNDPGVGYAAAKALAEIGPAAVVGVQQLADVLRNGNPVVQRAAARALLRIGPGAAEVVRSIAASLKNPDASLRHTLVEALREIGPTAASVLREIIPLLKDEDAGVRLNTIRALSMIGPGASKAVPNLLAVLGDADGRVRAEAAAALGNIGLNAPRFGRSNKAARHGQRGEERPGLESLGKTAYTLIEELESFREIGNVCRESSTGGFSYRDVASELKISDNALKAQINRVRNLFGDYFLLFGYPPHEPKPFAITDGDPDLAGDHRTIIWQYERLKSILCEPCGRWAWELTCQFLDRLDQLVAARKS
jgi:HEAT repeat protein